MCPFVSSCNLFPLFAMRASLKTWQIRYCENDHTQCERFKLGCGGMDVPAELLPNGKSLPVVKPKS